MTTGVYERKQNSRPVVRGLFVGRGQLSEQHGGQRFKVRYDIVGEAVTCENSAVYVGGVNTGHELIPSGRVKRASLTTVCEWMLSAWVAL